jgi:hypothetical protein
MAAGKLDLFVEQGATFTYTLTLTDDVGAPVNLTGYTARMQMRRAVQATPALISLTTENGRITITPLTGVITLTIEAAATASLNFQTAVYDLEIQSAGGIVTRVLQGNVALSKEVTR